MMKVQKGDLFTESHSNLARWRKHFSQLLNVQGVNDVGQTTIRTAGSLVSEPSAFEFELAIDQLKRHKSPGIDPIPAELIKEGGRACRSKIHILLNSIWNKEKLPEEWKESIIVPIYKKGGKRDCSNYRGLSILSLRTKFYPTSCSQS